MQRHLRKSAWIAVAAVVILSLSIGTIIAHEGRPVGDYRFVVGWLEEPAYEGGRNAASVTITKVVDNGNVGAETESSGDTHGNGDNRSEGEEGEGHHNGKDEDNDESSGHDSGGDGDQSSLMPSAPKVLASVAGQHHETTEPVEGLEGSIQVEVTHVASGASKIMDLIAVFGEPGHYVAHMIPTASGVYEFRVFGTIEGTAIDETFASRGGGGGFDDIRSSAGLHFPEELPEIREIESGVRGALQTAQEAQDAALAAQEGGGNTLAIVALIVGIAGVVVAGIAFVAIAVLPTLRRQ